MTKQSHAFVHLHTRNMPTYLDIQDKYDTIQGTLILHLVWMLIKSPSDTLLRVKPLLNALVLETPEIVIKELSEIAIIAEAITRWRSKNDYSGDDGWKKIMDGLDREGMCWHEFMRYCYWRFLRRQSLECVRYPPPSRHAL